MSLVMSNILSTSTEDSEVMKPFDESDEPVSMVINNNNKNDEEVLLDNESLTNKEEKEPSTQFNYSVEESQLVDSTTNPNNNNLCGDQNNPGDVEYLQQNEWNNNGDELDKEGNNFSFSLNSNDTFQPISNDMVSTNNTTTEEITHALNAEQQQEEQQKDYQRDSLPQSVLLTAATSVNSTNFIIPPPPTPPPASTTFIIDNNLLSSSNQKDTISSDGFDINGDCRYPKNNKGKNNQQQNWTKEVL
mmetsp:Transcript_183/g.293  ORF Transcript_183/g.293 Transcript_183/m.293 type:complete len:246 (-) Transcript_183:262-999(-)